MEAEQLDFDDPSEAEIYKERLEDDLEADHSEVDFSALEAVFAHYCEADFVQENYQLTADLYSGVDLFQQMEADFYPQMEAAFYQQMEADFQVCFECQLKAEFVCHLEVELVCQLLEANFLEAAFWPQFEAIFLQLEAAFEIAVAIEAAFSAFEVVFLRQSLEAD